MAKRNPGTPISSFTVPAYGGRELVYHVIDDDGRTATLTRDNNEHVRLTMPSASVQHFHDDLNHILRAKPPSGNAVVNRLLRGEGQWVGKGNDGIVYVVGDHAVKVSTTVPYQPENLGHRTPRQAVEHLRAEYETHRALAALPSVPPVAFVEHDGRGWLVKPVMRFDVTLDKAQADQIARDIDVMHANGLTLGDLLQVGVGWNGVAYLSDLGQVRPIQQYDVEDDKERVRRLYRDNGLYEPPDLEFLRREMMIWQRPLARAVEQGDGATIVHKFHRWWAAAKAYAAGVHEVNGGLAQMDVQDAMFDLRDRAEAVAGIALHAD